MFKNRSLKRANFSKPQTVIFAVAFALMGYLIFRTFAASNPNLPGDLNNDNVVNGADLSLLLSNYGTTNSAGDVNGDGTVNAVDLSVLMTNYGRTYTPVAKPTIPTGLTAAAGSGSVTLKWNANPTTDQVDFYQVYLNDANYNLNVTGTTFTVTGLTNGTAYNFRVSAHNSAGYGNWTNPVSATPAGAGAITWRGDFETGDLSQWRGVSGNGGLQAADPSRAQIITSPVRQGKYALKITVQPGDRVDVSNDWERAELLLPQEETQGYEGKDVWYAWSEYFPSYTQHGAFKVTQFHPTGSGGSGQSGFASNSCFQFYIYGEANPATGNTNWYSNCFSTPLLTDHWYDIVLHMKWSSDPTIGAFELFADGKRTMPLTHGSTLFKVDEGVYMKQGVYRSPQNYAETVLYDGERIGTSYSAVVADFPAGTWPSTAP